MEPRRHTKKPRLTNQDLLSSLSHIELRKMEPKIHTDNPRNVTNKSVLSAMYIEHVEMEPRRHTASPIRVTNQTSSLRTISQNTTGHRTQPIQNIGGEVTVNNNSCTPLEKMAIVGYILLYSILYPILSIFLCRKGNSNTCNCCPTINEARTAVLKKSVIEQILLAAVGILIPGAIAGGVVVAVLGAAGVLLPKEG